MFSVPAALLMGLVGILVDKKKAAAIAGVIIASGMILVALLPALG